MPRYTIVLGLIVATIIVALQFFAVPLSAAAPTRTAAFQNYVNIVDGGIPEGQGTVSCPDGFVATGELFDVSVTQTAGVVTGTWYMVHYGAAASDGGSISGGHISKMNFRLTGNWTSPGSLYGHTVACSTAPIRATVTITGNCGTDVTVTLVASNGVTATFPGDAACTFTHE